MTLREFDRMVLLRDLADAGFGRRTYPAGTTGGVVDLVEGRTHREVKVFDPPDVLTVALGDLAPADDARRGQGTKDEARGPRRIARARGHASPRQTSSTPSASSPAKKQSRNASGRTRARNRPPSAMPASAGPSASSDAPAACMGSAHGSSPSAPPAAAHAEGIRRAAQPGEGPGTPSPSRPGHRLGRRRNLRRRGTHPEKIG